MELNRLVKTLYKPLLSLLAAAIISGGCARARPTPAVTPNPTTPAVTQPYQTPARTPTLTPTTPSPTPTVTPTVTPTPSPLPTNIYEFALSKGLPEFVAKQLAYLPFDANSKQLVGEIVVDDNWDKDKFKNKDDAYVIDPSNTINQPKLTTINFIKRLKKHNKDLLLSEVYQQLDKALYTVDSNPEYFLEETLGSVSELEQINLTTAHLTVRLVDGIPAFAGYPRALSLGARQTYSILWDYVKEQEVKWRRKTGILGREEQAVREIVIPAIGYIVSLQEQGKIDALNGWGIPDKKLEDEGIRQLLFPVDMIGRSIKSGDTSGVPYDVGKDNANGGQEWLREMAVKDYNDKSSLAYKESIRYGQMGLIVPWPNSTQDFRDTIKKMGDDLFVFIRGYPTYLRGPPYGSIVPKLTGQGEPSYSIFVGRLFGKAVFVVRANYPQDGGGTHSEPSMIIPENIPDALFSYHLSVWGKRKPFLEDYKENGVKPSVSINTADGRALPLRLD